MPDSADYDSIASTLGEHIKRSAEALGRIPRDVRRWYSDLPASTGDYLSAARMVFPGGNTRENWEAAKGAYAPAFAAAADISNATSGMTGAPHLSAGEAAMSTLPARLAYANAAAEAGARRNIMIGPVGAENLFYSGRPAAKEALQLADKLADAGKGREDVWKATAEHFLRNDPEFAGVHYGPEGLPRIELSDAGIPWAAGTKKTIPTYGVDLTSPERAWPHKTLYEAYPEMRNRELVISNPPEQGATAIYGSYDPRSKSLAINLSEKYAPESVLAHESQHGVQGIEGTLSGGNWRDNITTPTDVLGVLNGEGKVPEPIVRDILQHVRDNLGYKVNTIEDLRHIIREANKPQKGYGWGDAGGINVEDFAHTISSGLARSKYKRLYGEAEARNVQSRLNMTPEERRATPPWQTLDVPEDQLITKY
jgi:hypothetical protein